MDIIAVIEPWTTHLLILSLSFSALLILCLPIRYTPPKDGKSRVAILVLGDIGRSPRMQYHALSIARKGGLVEIIGYDETPARPELLENPSIKIRGLKAPPKYLDTSTAIKFLFFAPFKAVYQLFQLLNMLLYEIPPTTNYLLLQNPPAIPTLMVAMIASMLRGQKVVIDWHNFGYSMLKTKLKEHPIVYAAKLYEMIFCRFAHANFTVTSSMQTYLRDSWRIGSPIHILYDRPPSHFQPLSSDARAEFLRSHPDTAPMAEKLISGKMKLIVSSTSWSADEDFGIFLDALLEYDRRASAENFLRPSSVPDVLVVITGKGPQKEMYLQRIQDMEFQAVTIKTVWLEAVDYPKMIACADVGVSLHTSTSGLDLPMKVVDLFGVGVPVVALKFQAIGELVKEGVNGTTFTKPEELSAALVKLFDPRWKELEKLKAGAMKEMESRWDENWDKVAAKVFGL
ncbi:glycosyl transferases group 1-domain-containing protein [Pyronema omphalodes]|nr:glycosyl transferases group 1-domain-containing protein [Pyronema omphalodes]